uniref:Uncharacterized protein n=1 Tax=Oryza punctata TaxID=4537 RepID=G9C2U9_ORYPU|nr:hypothetical protein [Oryza punctata]
MAPLFHMEALLPSSISPKLNSILHSHIYPQVGHVFRALAKFKSLLLDVVRKKRAPSRGGGGGKKYAIGYRSRPEKTKKRIASFMKLLRFNWAAAVAVTPARAKDLELHYHPYYYDDSTWNVVVPADAAEELRGGDDGEECGYLCWLEEETSADALPAAEEGEDGGDGDGDCNGAVNEIDRLAERFIARCHAKFLLEKQESYRRYQEMMARSM